MKLLRVNAFADQHNVAQIELLVAVSEAVGHVQRFSCADPLQLIDVAEKLRLVGNAMLLHARRRAPEEP